MIRSLFCAVFLLLALYGLISALRRAVCFFLKRDLPLTRVLDLTRDGDPALTLSALAAYDAVNGERPPKTLVVRRKEDLAPLCESGGETEPATVPEMGRGDLYTVKSDTAEPAGKESEDVKTVARNGSDREALIRGRDRHA